LFIAGTLILPFCIEHLFLILEKIGVGCKKQYSRSNNIMCMPLQHTADPYARKQGFLFPSAMIFDDRVSSSDP